MGVGAFLGFWYLRNFNVALSVLSDTPFVFAANWELSAIPMFLLMGAIAGNSGIGTGLFRAAHAWFGGLPGGLAVATNWACAGFGAASGSSIAAAATMARLAVPEMFKHKYDKGLATGVVASGGTLDALIPPSILFVIYGVFAEVSVVQAADRRHPARPADRHRLHDHDHDALLAQPLARRRPSSSTTVRRCGASAGHSLARYGRSSCSSSASSAGSMSAP